MSAKQQGYIINKPSDKFKFLSTNHIVTMIILHICRELLPIPNIARPSRIILKLFLYPPIPKMMLPNNEIRLNIIIPVLTPYLSIIKPPINGRIQFG